MIIPYTMLKAETLRGIVEEFVLREGTDYGYGHSVRSESNRTSTLDGKVSQVMRQLERGEVVVLYDQESETCDLALRSSAAVRAVATEASGSKISDENSG